MNMKDMLILDWTEWICVVYNIRVVVGPGDGAMVGLEFDVVDDDEYHVDVVDVAHDRWTMESA